MDSIFHTLLKPCHIITVFFLVTKLEKIDIKMYLPTHT